MTEVNWSGDGSSYGVPESLGCPSTQAQRSRSMRCGQARHQTPVERLETRVLLSAFAFQTIASFPSSNAGGSASPVIIDTAGNLFGTTQLGGANGDGTVFEIAHDSTQMTTLVSFDGANGSQPRSGLTLDSSGNIFGTTGDGGTDNLGTVFEISHGSTNITTIASFNGHNGAEPFGNLLINSSGEIVGTTAGGGTYSDGTVFYISPGTSTISTAVSFNGTNGAEPCGGLSTDANGNAFGTTLGGGSNSGGTIFELGGSSFQTLASLSYPGGVEPFDGLTLDSSGDLYGTADVGGAYGYGTVFGLGGESQSQASLTNFGTAQRPSIAYSNTPAVLASFNNTNGSYPQGGLMLDGKGDLFGTTSSGGASGSGTVFEIASGSRTITTLFNFDGSNGANPLAGLAIDSRGDLFGTTSSGGANNSGTVFELAVRSDTTTTLQSSAPTSAVGNNVTFIAKVSSTNAGSPAETGTVSFFSDGVLLGSSPVAANGGASFTTADLAVGTHAITAAYSGDSNYGSSTSSSIQEIVEEPTAKLIFAAAPSDTAAGSPIGGAGGVQIIINDLSGSQLTNDNSIVMITLSGGTFAGGATTATASAIAGVATFDNLIIDAAGTYQLTATDGLDVAAKSQSFNAMPGPAAQLIFTQQPSNASPGAPIAPAPSVSVEDSYGNRILNDRSTVTVKLNHGALSGSSHGASVPTTNGTAIFPRLVIRQHGTYALQASDGSLASVTSSAFTIGPVPITPGSLITIPNQTVSADQNTLVRFYNSKTHFSITEVATSPGPLIVPAPVYFNMSAGAAAPGIVSAEVTESDGSVVQVPYQFAIAAPAKPSGPPGAATLAFVKQSYSDLQQAESDVLAQTSPASQQTVINGFQQELTPLANMMTDLSNYLAHKGPAPDVLGASAGSKVKGLTIKAASLRASDALVGAVTTVTPSTIIHTSAATSYNSQILNDAALKGSKILTATSYATAFLSVLGGPELGGAAEIGGGALYAMNALSAAYQSAMVKVNLAIENGTLSDISFKEEAHFLASQATGYVVDQLTTAFGTLYAKTFPLGDTEALAEQEQQIIGAFVNISTEKAASVFEQMENNAEAAEPATTFTFKAVPAPTMPAGQTSPFEGDHKSSDGTFDMNVAADGSATTTFAGPSGEIGVSGFVDADGYFEVLDPTPEFANQINALNITIEFLPNSHEIVSGYFINKQGAQTPVNEKLPAQQPPTRVSEKLIGQWVGVAPVSDGSTLTIGSDGRVSYNDNGTIFTGTIDGSGNLKATASISGVTSTLALVMSFSGNNSLSGTGTLTTFDPISGTTLSNAVSAEFRR